VNRRYRIGHVDGLGSEAMRAMDAARLRAHRPLILPGGNFLERGAPIAPYPAGTPVREVTT